MRGSSISFDEFLRRAGEAHQARYVYPEQSWTGVKTKILAVCPEHGEFQKLASAHMRGEGCPKCGRSSRTMSQTEFVKRMKDTFGDSLDCSKVVFTDTRCKVEVGCPTHGWFTTDASTLLRKGAIGCKECGWDTRSSALAISESEWMKKFHAAHGDRYLYRGFVAGAKPAQVIVVCAEHGEFTQGASTHAQGSGCLGCWRGHQLGVPLPGFAKATVEDVVSRSRKVHGDVYDYDEATLEGNYLSFRCRTHGVFSQFVPDHTSGHGCRKCAKPTSAPQQELEDYCRNLSADVVTDHKFGTRKEIDVFFPGKGFGVEMDGLYWHSAGMKGRLNIARKHKEVMASGLRVLHVFEDEWLRKKDIVKATIRHMVGLSERVNARSCTVSELTQEISHEFHEAHHIQGGHGSGGRSFGLYHQGTLVMVMDFTRVASDRRGGGLGEVELRRLSSTCSVRGGASRLFKNARLAMGFRSCVSYSDNRAFAGGVYPTMGFTSAGSSRPDYFYFKRGDLVRHRKARFTRARLAKLEGFNPQESEAQNMARMGWLRIYDAGKTKWRWEAP